MSDGRRLPGSLGVIFSIVALDLIGFGLLIPQLGVYAVKFGASPLSAALLLSVYSLMQLLFAPVLGRLSDRYGRRPVLLVSLAGSLAAAVVAAQNGARIVRAHDVRETVDALRVVAAAGAMRWLLPTPPRSRWR